MSVLWFSLLGRLGAWGRSRQPVELHAQKARELLCFLLLSADRPQPRETLAEVLWGEDASAGQSRKYLRQAVWQLQAALEAAAPGVGGNLLHAEQEWIQIRGRGAAVWLDVAELEQAYALIRSSREPLSDAVAERVEAAIPLYHGDLLEGWYADWCVFERERYRAIYLAILERLISFCELSKRWECGVGYAVQVLRREPAHERTHRQLMRLLYQSGDRTAALRQYQRCAASLQTELGVEPAGATHALYEDVRADRTPRPEEGTPASGHRTIALEEGTDRNRRRHVLSGLHEVRKALDHARGVVDRDIASLKHPFEPRS